MGSTGARDPWFPPPGCWQYRLLFRNCLWWKGAVLPMVCPHSKDSLYSGTVCTGVQEKSWRATPALVLPMGSVEASIATASVEHLPKLNSTFPTFSEALLLRANPNKHPGCKSLSQSLCYSEYHPRQTGFWGCWTTGWNKKLNKGEFTEMRTLSPDTGFNTLARTPGDSARMAFGTLENAHTKWSRNVRTAQADGRGSDGRAQRNESAGMDILHKARKPN